MGVERVHISLDRTVAGRVREEARLQRRTVSNWVEGLILVALAHNDEARRHNRGLEAMGILVASSEDAG